MKLLLDTHVMLWWQNDRLLIGPKARGLISSPEIEILVSVVSLWEIAIKFRLGKLTPGCADTLRQAQVDGFSVLDVEAHHVMAVESLPEVKGHRDPFDHLLLAQAKAEGAALMTGDRILSEYPVRCISLA